MYAWERLIFPSLWFGEKVGRSIVPGVGLRIRFRGLGVGFSLVFRRKPPQALRSEASDCLIQQLMD